MSGRTYRMQKRAEDSDATRGRIVEATAALHREQGVSATTYLQIAERAGVGPATVYRHFPTLGALVMACGATVMREINPPLADQAPHIFAGLPAGLPRLERLVAELDAFYGRGAEWLAVAARDRDKVPELDGFLQGMAVGIAALVREALGPQASEKTVGMVIALTGVSVWEALQRQGTSRSELRAIMPKVLDCATHIGSAAISGRPEKM
jgi:AcrR family transcriptional regulator